MWWARRPSSALSAVVVAMRACSTTTSINRLETLQAQQGALDPEQQQQRQAQAGHCWTRPSPHHRSSLTAAASRQPSMVIDQEKLAKLQSASRIGA